MENYSIKHLDENGGVVLATTMYYKADLIQGRVEEMLAENKDARVKSITYQLNTTPVVVC